ncbi:MAG: hypothetical protein F6K14_18230 [Symploca sp. SIO2C1]|nr:hypothetical protein [Symploca sp. SIO2C1]
MNQNQSNKKPIQKAKGGGNVIQVGGDYTNTSNVKFLIPFFLIGVVALGGIAWTLGVGRITNPINTQSGQEQPTPNTSPIKKP